MVLDCRHPEQLLSQPVLETEQLPQTLEEGDAEVHWHIAHFDELDSDMAGFDKLDSGRVDSDMKHSSMSILVYHFVA
jgi:hypothetical protein